MPERFDAENSRHPTKVCESQLSETETETLMLVDSASRRLAPRPIPPGFMLDAILRLDEHRAGFLRFLHSASALRRQGVFMALTELNWERPEEFASWIARSSEQPEWKDANPYSVIASGLMALRVREIIHAVFGATPQGLVGALSRCGDDPLHEFTYTVLHALHDDPKNRARAKLLRHANEIDDDLVQVVWRLPPALLRPEVLDQISSPEQIDSYNPALQLIRRLHPNITDNDLALSFTQMPRGATLSHWVARWLERAECLVTAFPYQGDENVRPLVSSAQMRQAAIRYRNCLRDKIGSVALGRTIYYEHIGFGGAVAEVKALSSGHWMLDGIYGPANRRPHPEAVRALRNTLEGAGVLVAAAHTQDRGLHEVASLLSIHDFSGGSWLDLAMEEAA